MALFCLQDQRSKRTLLRESTTPSGAQYVGSSSPPAVKLLLDLHTRLGEAPTWDERTRRLWFVDINEQKIYSCDEEGGNLQTIETPETVGTIALTTDENILLAAMNRSVYPVDIRGGQIGPAIATVPENHGVDQMRFNDGKAGPNGVLIVGRMHLQFSEGQPGRLYRLHWDSPAEGRFEELLGPDVVGLPNGLAWNGSVMYHADTYHRTITAYPLDQDGNPAHDPGQPIKGDTVVRIPADLGGGPDGMCISRDGRLWIAFPEAGCIACFSPQDGSEVARVQLPVQNPTCPTFGGTKLDQIYVTSMEEEAADASEHWGGVFAVHISGEFGMAPAYKVKIPA